MIYSTDRERLREVFFEAWRKHRGGEPLDGVEARVAGVVTEHPEYHALLENAGLNRGRDFDTQPGAPNPFLHMAMHLTLLEQLEVDRPRGVRACYARLAASAADEHAAQHRMMECLGEWLWRAQRAAAPPPEDDYVECLRRLAKR